MINVPILAKSSLQDTSQDIRIKPCPSSLVLEPAVTVSFRVGHQLAAGLVLALLKALSKARDGARRDVIVGPVHSIDLTFA